jgi:hypothetical protein
VKPWYESAVALAVVSAVLGFALGLGSSLIVGWWNKKLEKSANTESIIVAFRGEISAIRGGLRPHAQMAVASLDKGTTLRDYGIVYPRAIFDSHVGRIGELRDPTLTFQIAAVYSMLETANAIGKQLTAGTLGPEGFPTYVDRVVRGFDMAVHLDMRLSEQTKNIGSPDWGSVIVSSQDAEDHNWAVGVIQRLAKKK